MEICIFFFTFIWWEYFNNHQHSNRLNSSRNSQWIQYLRYLLSWRHEFADLGNKFLHSAKRKGPTQCSAGLFFLFFFLHFFCLFLSFTFSGQTVGRFHLKLHISHKADLTVIKWIIRHLIWIYRESLSNRTSKGDIDADPAEPPHQENLTSHTCLKYCKTY